MDDQPGEVIEEGEMRPWIYDRELHGSVTSYSDRIVLDMVFDYPS